MTYHRTCGKGGTRNSPKERHCTDMPNFNKSTAGGFSKKPSKGKTVHNPDTSKRYKEMMSPYPKRQRKSVGERLGSYMIGRSKVTGRYD